MSTAYPRIRLDKDRERSLVHKHPWLFSGAIRSVIGEPKTGDIVAVESRNGQFMGLGHYIADASISCRLFYFGSEPIVVDDEFWLQRFHQAYAYRKQLGYVDVPNGAYRLFCSEGDFIPGLTVDIYNDTAVIHARTVAMERLIPLIVRFLEELVGCSNIYVKPEDATQSVWMKGEQAEVVFKEDGLQLIADVVQGQKTGFFLDQRLNRQLIQSYAKGKRVLNCFGYSGGFSVHALAAGAWQVTSVDISKNATVLCDRNVALNFADAPHESLTADCFEYLRDLSSGQFDVIVLDPPAFTKHASKIQQATRGYKDINRLAFEKVAPNGIVFSFSCSQHISVELFRKIVFSAAVESGRQIRIMHQLHQSPDHPVSIYHPEGEYLKGLVLQVE